LIRKTISVAVLLGLFCSGGTAPAAAADAKEAKVEREKPLQRCDQLADKAQLDCLARARERVLEARKKREQKNAPPK
jgi:hypothetical protein